MQENILRIPVGEIVAEKISRARVFEQYGLDYCCGGSVPLNEACKKKGIDPIEFLNDLSKSDAEVKDGDSMDWQKAGLTELTNHIVSTHHDYLNKELPLLNDLMEKVVTAHSGNHPELSKAAEILIALTAELTQHMAKEEQLLFPIIRQMDSTGKTDSQWGSVSNPIRVMEMEHDNAGYAFVSLRSITNDYNPPEDACTSYRALLAGLNEMELDTHQHILKENSILFPRAIALEVKLNQN